MAEASCITNNHFPLKPPRGQKVGRETGILMTVIKALLSSASASERESIKSTVEQEYKTLDKNLDSLILKKQQSLSTVMQTFRQTYTEIDNARERISEVKSNLQKCKMLLHCRREELERLWLEGIEHKHTLEMLDLIDRIRNVPPQFTKVVGRKQYIAASELLMSGINSWNEELEHIEGLKELKADLKGKREKLYQQLLEELNDEVFVKSLPSIHELKRAGSGVFSPFQRSSSDRNSSGRTKMNQIKARKIYLDVSTPSKYVTPSDENTTTDEFMNIIVKCIVELRALPKFKDDLRKQLEEKLMVAMNNISHQIIEYSDANPEVDEKSSPLIHFLEMVFSHFRVIVKHHITISGLMESLERSQPGVRSTISLTKEEIWGYAQSVLQSTLKLYFDLGDTKPISGTSYQNDLGNSLDLNSFFIKKKPPKQKKGLLFKFEYSLHGLSHISDFRDTLETGVEKHKFLVCKPNLRNIILVYNVVQDFCQEIEEASHGEKCDLRKFMGINMNRVFVQQIYKEISDAIELSKKNSDSWKEVISLDEAKRLKASRPILQGVALIGRSIVDMLSLAKKVPSHSDQLIRILDPVLSSYRETCEEVFTNLVRHGEKRIVSAMMVADDDIERLLKSLPNWNKLEKRKELRKGSFDESPEDIRAQNLREADLYVGLFGGKSLSQADILTEVKLMEQLARFHESMEWMSEMVSSVATFLQTHCQNPEMKEPLEKINALAALFHELGSTCLLLLNLEIRVHTFYYLSPLPTKSDFSPGLDSQIPDPDVVQLSRELGEIESVLAPSLQPIKTHYIFEGIGQLLSTVFIRGAGDIRRINENGVKKMCRNIFQIQQALSSVTKSPEVALDHAIQFYEIFLHPMQELFASVLEKGPQFREIEYMNAVQLLYRSKPGASKEPLNDYLTRLSNILGDVGVTV